MEKANFYFRLLNQSDLPLLVDWLKQRHLQNWWRAGEITLESVREKYLPRIFGEEDARPYIAWLDDMPVGYIQYYNASAGNTNWWPDHPDSGVLGIDTFIGDGKRLNKGLGTTMVLQFVNLLLEDPKVKEIRVDPHPDNYRAICCYEKVGFQKKGKITNPDGPAIMMVLKRQ